MTPYSKPITFLYTFMISSSMPLEVYTFNPLFSMRTRPLSTVSISLITIDALKVCILSV